MSTRLRGLLGTALTWGVAFGACYLAYRFTVGPFVGELPFTLEKRTVVAALYGALSGLLFGALVMRLGRRRTLEDLSLRSFAAGGAAAGVAVPLAVVALLLGLGGLAGVTAAAAAGFAACGGALGLATATASLRFARRGAALQPPAAERALPSGARSA